MKSLAIFVTVAVLHCVAASHLDVTVPCTTAADCVPFSRSSKDVLCKDGFCVCKNNSGIRNCSSVDVMHHDNRSMGPLVYRTCKHDQECQFHKGFCNTTISQCECQKDYVPSSNKQHCLAKAQSIDFPCVDEKQCLAFLPNTTCHYGQCTCAPGFHYVDKLCHGIVAFGNACTKPQECSHIEGGVCTDRNICGCPAETVINADRKRCLPVARKILDNCTENAQCTMTFSDSICVDRACQCQSLYHFEAELNRCVVNKGLDEDCGNSYECYQSVDEAEDATEKAVQCLSNKCVCAEKYYREDEICVNTAAGIVASTLLVILTSLTGAALSRV